MVIGSLVFPRFDQFSYRAAADNKRLAGDKKIGPSRLALNG